MPRRPRHDRSLATRLLGLQLAVVAVVVALGALVAILSARSATFDRHRDETRAVARILAIEPTVRRALERPGASDALEPLVERLRGATGMSFITVMRPDRTRVTHPDPALIGRPFVGRTAPALAGRTFTERYTGTLGPSVRTVAPLRDDAGRIIGLVAVGVTLDRIGGLVADQIPALLGLALAAFVVGGTLSVLLARRIKRQTLGLEPERIAAMYQHHDATLHAIREGVLVTNAAGRLILANDEARRLLGLPAGDDGGLRELPLPPPVRGLLDAARPVRDRTLVVGDRVLVVGHTPTVVGGRPAGTVTTLRDRTELEALGRELDAVRGMTDALRAQAHEAANRLHTIVGLVELGRTEDAVRFGSDEAAFASDLVADLEARMEEPALVALVLGKVAVARERGVTLVLAEDTGLPPTGVPSSDLVTIVGNLLDNAIDAAAGASPSGGGRVELLLGVVDDELVIEVSDDGPGLPPGPAARLFEAGFSTKSPRAGGRGVGLALVAGAARRLGGGVEAEDRPAGGALLRVLLPVRLGAAGAGPRS